MPSHSNISAITLCSHPISVITRSCTSAITPYPFCVLIIYAVPSHFLVAFLHQCHHTVLFFISAITLYLKPSVHISVPSHCNLHCISAITLFTSAITLYLSHLIQCLALYKCHHTFLPVPSHCTFLF